VTAFYPSNGELVCDGVSLSAIADAEGTPLYVYSAATIRARYRELDDAFDGHPHRLHYALKANSTLGIARLLRELGSAADANSIWEIELARMAGFRPVDVVLTGVGKSPSELERALTIGVSAINVESAGELARIESIAERTGRPARVAIRVNPDIDAGSHPRISTGLRINKFGVPADTTRDLIRSIGRRKYLNLVAIHVHVGSQITTIDPLRRAARFVAGMAAEAARAGIHLEYLDVGGGLGIAYDGAAVVAARDYAAALVEEIRPTGLPIVVEPGRWILGPSAALVARVVDLKPRTEESEFVVLDAGMAELMRPALYDAYHRIDPLAERSGPARQYEVVGPICETTDVIGERLLAPLEVGDGVAIRDTGAYGSAMASNYNRHPIPAEVLVDDGSWRVIRRRQTIEDMTALEC
jgi:diaminopimelate decarboxylase